MHEVIPAATSIAPLVNPSNPAVADAVSRDLQAAVTRLGLKLHVVSASTEHEIDAAFVQLAHLRTGGLVIATDAFFNSRSAQLATLALRYAIPTIYQFREFTAAGGLKTAKALGLTVPLPLLGRANEVIE